MSLFNKVRLWFHKLGGKSVANDPFPPFLPLGSGDTTGNKPVVSSCNDLHQPQQHPLPARQQISYQPEAIECGDDKRTTSGLLRAVSQQSGAPPPSQLPTYDQNAAKAAHAEAAPQKQAVSPPEANFFTEYGESNRYSVLEIIGKGSYGIVCSAVDNYTGEKVAIKKITNVFEHVSDATRILREVKLLRLLKHPDIVMIKHIMLPPNSRDYKDIYVVFELMETDLHQVIKANDDLTPEHHQFFLYQMLRGLKYLHSAKVFHRDLKPKNILANADCKLKICDFGLARPAFDTGSTMIFWTDYVATRWYRAPELCGSFFAKYSPSIDIWGVGCIFAEVLLGRPLFPGKNVVNQLEIITDLLGTPSEEVIAKVRNEKARRFLLNLPKKQGVPFSKVFPGVEYKALQLLRALLSFDPSDRPTAEQALQHPYFAGLHNPAREPTTIPVSKLAFEFDRRKLSTEEVRELIYLEILEYHPAAMAVHMTGNPRRNFSQPNALDNFKRMWLHLEQNPGAVLPPGYQHKGRQAVASSAALKRPGAAAGIDERARGHEPSGAPPAAGVGARDVAGVERGAARVVNGGGVQAAAPDHRGGGEGAASVMHKAAGPGAGESCKAIPDPRRSAAEVGRAVQRGKGAPGASCLEAGRRPDPGAGQPQLQQGRYVGLNASSGSSNSEVASSPFSAAAAAATAAVASCGISDRGRALSLSPDQLYSVQESTAGPDGCHLTASTGRHSLQLSRADEMVHACAPTCIPAGPLGATPSLYPRADAWTLVRHSVPGPVWGEQEARSLSSTFSSQAGEGDSSRLQHVHALAEESGAGAAWRWDQGKAGGRKEVLRGAAGGDSVPRRKKEAGVDAGSVRA